MRRLATLASRGGSGCVKICLTRTHNTKPCRNKHHTERRGVCVHRLHHSGSTAAGEGGCESQTDDFLDDTGNQELGF